MTTCVVTSRAGVEDGTPCVQAGAHSGDCPGDTCEGCAPTPAARGRIVCTRHDDAVRTALQAFADLYQALGESSTRNAPAGSGDPTDTAEPIPPIPAARMLIRATLVGWAKTLEDDFGIPLPDERRIELDTRGTIQRRQWDVDIAVAGMRGLNGDRPTPERRAHLAQVAEAHRRTIRTLQDERAAGVDVIRALAAHVNDHRAKLLGDQPPESTGATCP